MYIDFNRFRRAVSATFSDPRNTLPAKSLDLLLTNLYGVGAIDENQHTELRKAAQIAFNDKFISTNGAE